ncbi:type II secretion system minor pseudopilin GspJ [Thiohalorhabdus methylotrophus]|uniref:Type II secretion system protein J n=1 Tax=Thiohalorhabdus methylotrophus TaxID=3242694 RepID=A0ABV4TZV3_9GAMM
MSAPGNREAGMTLLEVLIALALFALVAAAGYTALRQGIATEERLQETRAFWQRLESVLSLIRRDLGQARALAPRAPGREWSLAFQGGETGASLGEGVLFRFTRGGNTSFREGPASPYQRIAYGLREDTLVRRSWSRLNAPASLEPREADILENVAEVRVRYLNGETLEWASSWPPGTTTAEGPGLPRAVEVSFELEDHGRFKRLFHVGAP